MNSLFSQGYLYKIGVHKGSLIQLMNLGLWIANGVLVDVSKVLPPVISDTISLGSVSEIGVIVAGVLGLEIPAQNLLELQCLSPSQWQSDEHLFFILASLNLYSTCLQLATQTLFSQTNLNLVSHLVSTHLSPLRIAMQSSLFTPLAGSLGANQL